MDRHEQRFLSWFRVWDQNDQRSLYKTGKVVSGSSQLLRIAKMTVGKYIISVFLLGLVVMVGCVKDDPLVGPLQEVFVPEVPAHFERPRIPESNP